jgi:hypothetical protein
MLNEAVTDAMKQCGKDEKDNGSNAEKRGIL